MKELQALVDGGAKGHADLITQKQEEIRQFQDRQKADEEKLNQTLDTHRKEIEDITGKHDATLDQKERQIADHLDHATKTADALKELIQAKEEQERKHAADIETLKRGHANDCDKIKRQCENNKAILSADHEHAIQSLHDETEEKCRTLNDTIAQNNTAVNALQVIII